MNYESNNRLIKSKNNPQIRNIVMFYIKCVDIKKHIYCRTKS